jgi:hypothetical protein
MSYLKRIQELRRKVSNVQEVPKILPVQEVQPQPSNHEQPDPQAQPKADRRVAYMVDLPVTFEGRQYRPGDIVYLSEEEAVPFLKPQPEPQPQADTSHACDKPGRFEALAVDAKGQVLDSHTVAKDTFKYRVLKPLELHGKSYQPGDVLELPADDAQWLLQDGTAQATCWWARSSDFSSEGYKQIREAGAKPARS